MEQSKKSKFFGRLSTIGDIGMTKNLGKRWLKKNRNKQEMDEYKICFDIIMDEFGNIIEGKVG